MKKYLVLLATLLLATPALAAQPKVSCELMYIKSTTGGATEIFETVSVPAVGELVSFYKFKFNAKVSQICASDASTCIDSYRLSVALAKGISETRMDVALSNNLKNSERFSTSLKVGKETAYVNCDHSKQ